MNAIPRRLAIGALYVVVGLLVTTLVCHFGQCRELPYLTG